MRATLTVLAFTLALAAPAQALVIPHNCESPESYAVQNGLNFYRLLAGVLDFGIASKRVWFPTAGGVLDVDAVGVSLHLFQWVGGVRASPRKTANAVLGLICVRLEDRMTEQLFVAETPPIVGRGGVE